MSGVSDEFASGGFIPPSTPVVLSADDFPLHRYGSPARAALRHALEQVYAGDQSVETDAVLDQLDTLGYRVVER